MKKTLTQKQIADYEQICPDRNNGHTSPFSNYCNYLIRRKFVNTH